MAIGAVKPRAHYSPAPSVRLTAVLRRVAVRAAVGIGPAHWLIDGWHSAIAGHAAAARGGYRLRTPSTHKWLRRCSQDRLDGQVTPRRHALSASSHACSRLHAIRDDPRVARRISGHDLGDRAAMVVTRQALGNWHSNPDLVRQALPGGANERFAGGTDRRCHAHGAAAHTRLSIGRWARRRLWRCGR